MSPETPVDMMAAADELAALRPYRLPDPVAWWPPAPGWWMVAVLALIGCVAATLWLLRRRRCTAAARLAQQELARLRHGLAVDSDSSAFVRQLSKLLRRYALAAFPRGQVAALTGDDWLAFLDTHGGDGRFANGPGRQLIDAPYRVEPDVSTEQLASLVDEWIQHNRRVRT